RRRAGRQRGGEPPGTRQLSDIRSLGWTLVTAKAMPMFPLGTVLLPHSTLPLTLCEDRYRALAETCLRGDGRFGVVLIERGFEVGGGDSRFDVGTVARISDAAHAA